ncbi:MAG: hypothetical protein ACOYCB_07075 [Fastidiosipilaceae bacterium]
MAKNIDPELKRIGSYLHLEDTAIFVVPEYQRAYSWEKNIVKSYGKI